MSVRVEVRISDSANYTETVYSCSRQMNLWTLGNSQALIREIVDAIENFFGDERLDKNR